jgi:hypothetical protein
MALTVTRQDKGTNQEAHHHRFQSLCIASRVGVGPTSAKPQGKIQKMSADMKYEISQMAKCRIPHTSSFLEIAQQQHIEGAHNESLSTIFRSEHFKMAARQNGSPYSTRSVVCNVCILPFHP